MYHEPAKLIINADDFGYSRIFNEEITFVSIKKGYTIDKDGKEEERIKTSLTVNFDELPLLIEALQNFKNKLESGSFS